MWKTGNWYLLGGACFVNLCNIDFKMSFCCQQALSVSEELNSRIKVKITGHYYLGKK